MKVKLARFGNNLFNVHVSFVQSEGYWLAFAEAHGPALQLVGANYGFRIQERSRTLNRAISHALTELAVQIDRMPEIPLEDEP